MATTALKLDLPFVEQERLGGPDKTQRLEIYGRTQCSRFQIAQIEAVVADSGLRLVGKGALDNMRTRFVSIKNKAVRVIESHTCERMFAYRLEFDPGVVGYYAQARCRGIERTNENGARHVSHATLDFLVYRFDCIELVECKTEAWLEAHEGKDGWHREGDGWTCDPYKQWAEARGLVFRVFVLAEPFANQLRTSEAMYATMDLPLTREELRVAERAIALLAKKPYSIEDMGETLPGFNGRIALSLLAQHKCYGLVQSTPFDLPQHFYLYSDQEQARLADAQALDAVRRQIAQPADLDPLTTASATDLKFAYKRFEIVQRIEARLERGSVRMRKLAVKVREAVSQGKPALSACLTQYAKSGNRESRLDPVQQECMTWVIRALWNRGKVRTRKNLWFELEKECQRHHVVTPSRETLNSHLRQEDATKRALAAGGMRAYQAARPISDPTLRSGRAIGYGHTLHIDSSQFDGRCVKQVEEAFEGNKPWFYIGIDEAIEKPMAKAFYFGKACTNGVALLMRDFVRRHGFLPFVIVLDRGSENDSKWLQAFCLEKGITLIQSPTGGSRFNGQAESAIKRINENVAHDLPGSTKPDQKGRKVDGKYKSEKTARLTFHVLNQALEDYAFKDMPETPTDDDYSPDDRMDEAMSRYGVMGRPQVLDDDYLIKTSVDIKFTGKATEKRGIKLASGIFTSKPLSILLRRYQPEEVRQDCENGSLLFVKIGGTWVKAFLNAILTLASQSVEERLFDHCWAPYARRNGRKRAQDSDRKRYHRHQEAEARAEAAAAQAVVDAKQGSEQQDTEAPDEDFDALDAWNNCEPLTEED